MRRAAFILLALALLATLPWLVPQAWIAVLVKMLIASLFAMAFNLLSGQGGMLSFGQAAYFAVGTFATLHLMKAAEAGLGFPTPLLPLAGAAAGLVVGSICAVFATLRSGVYFSMITLAIAELFYSLAPALSGTFGGEGGLSSMRMPWAGFDMGSDMQVYYLVAGWSVAAVGLLYFYTLTPFGRLTLSIRENEQRVRFLGFNTYHAKILIFSISAMLSGLAGGLLAVANESANYVLFETNASAAVVLNSFIGGVGVFFGPVLGSVLLTGFAYFVSDRTAMLPLYQGAIFILVMVYAPQGIGGLVMQHAIPFRQGWWTRLVVPYLCALIPMASFTAAFVFVVEMLHRFFAGGQFAQLRRGGTLQPAEFLGRMWDVAAFSTWSIPVLLVALGVVVLIPGRKRIRAIWEAGPA